MENNTSIWSLDVTALYKQYFKVKKKKKRNITL